MAAAILRQIWQSPAKIAAKSNYGFTQGFRIPNGGLGTGQGCKSGDFWPECTLWPAICADYAEEVGAGGLVGVIKSR